MLSSAGESAVLKTNLIRPNTRFLPQLDLLRSFAVVLVVLDHTAFALDRPAFHGILLGNVGVTGVFMFFVHTALVLMWSLERKPYALDFYIRRVFRVYPLAIAGTLAVVLTHSPLSLGTNPYFLPYPITFKNVIANIFLVFDFLYSHGYHALLHVEWTLPWELQMYLLLPALYAYVTRERNFWSIFLLWVLAVAIDLQFHFTPLSFPGSVPNFLAGVIAFQAYKRFAPRLPAWLFPIALIAFTACVVTAPTLRVCWSLTVLLGMGLPLFHSFRSSAFNKSCNLLARYSYGIYLSHPFGIYLGIGILHAQPRPLQLAVELASTAIFSVLSYHLLESPMIRLGSHLAAQVQMRSIARDSEQNMS